MNKKEAVIKAAKALVATLFNESDRQTAYLTLAQAVVDLENENGNDTTSK